MFQLIVAVISIALFAALAIAAMYYGGDAFTKSSEKANLTTLVNQAQQISGAAALYKTDKGYGIETTTATGATLVDDLATDPAGYLSAVPTPSKIAEGAWDITAGGEIIVPFNTALSAAALTDLCAADGPVEQMNATCTDGAGAAGTSHFTFPL